VEHPKVATGGRGHIGGKIGNGHRSTTAIGMEGNGGGEGRFDEYMKWGSGADYRRGRGVERVECLGSNTQERKILGAED